MFNKDYLLHWVIENPHLTDKALLAYLDVLSAQVDTTYSSTDEKHNTALDDLIDLETYRDKDSW